jgi:hypothetical protein
MRDNGMEKKFMKPPPRQRPENIAYFTGNPEYYSKLEEINSYIRNFQVIEVQKCHQNGIYPPIQTIRFRYNSMDAQEFGIDSSQKEISANIHLEADDLYSDPYMKKDSDSSVGQDVAEVPPYESDLSIRDALPPWMSRHELQKVKAMKLREASYKDLVHKLNLVFYAKGT